MKTTNDIDLTGGFRLDKVALGLFLALAGSWYTQTAKIDNLQVQLALQEKARTEVKAAEAQVEEARRKQDESERQQLRDSLGELKQQLKLTALDVADLKIAVGTK